MKPKQAERIASAVMAILGAVIMIAGSAFLGWVFGLNPDRILLYTVLVWLLDGYMQKVPAS